MITYRLLILCCLFSLSKINAQIITNDSVKLDYDKIYAFALDGNPKAALSLLEIDLSKKVTQKDLKFKTDFEDRFKFDVDRSNFLERRKSKIDTLMKIYRDYWRLSFLNKESNNDSLIMKNVFNFLKKNYAPAKKLIINIDSLHLYEKEYIKSIGYHSTGFGTTGSIYDLLVWKTEKDTIYKIKYDGKITSVKVYYMDDFITLGWEQYATLGKYYPGGWATTNALYCFADAYDLKSENFLISFINHEGRHFADYKLFPKLKGIGAADLEYRTKLTELSLLTQITLYSTLSSFIDNSNYGSENGHSIANFCVIRDLSKVLFNNDFEKDINKWKGVSVIKINKAAAKILKENTYALKKIPSVEKFIKQ
jgi:hypothetical protein